MHLVAAPMCPLSVFQAAGLRHWQVVALQPAAKSAAVLRLMLQERLAEASRALSAQVAVRPAHLKCQEVAG